MYLECKKCGVQNRSIAKHCKKCGTAINDNDSNILDEIVGRDEIKKCLIELVKSIAQFNKGWNSSNRFNMNMILLGGTGTGKTTLPNYICKYLFDKKIVSSEKVTLIDASGFDKFIESSEDNFKESKGGIIFIDNFHKLLPGHDNHDSLSNIDKFVYEIDKSNNNPVVIIAGNKNILEDYININPSFKIRYEYCFKLNDYSSSELYAICKNKLNDYGLSLNEESANQLISLFKVAIKKKESTFANAHLAVNMAEDLARNYYLRISEGANDNHIVTKDDIKQDVEELKSLNQILAELDELVGLEKVKAAVRDIASFVNHQKKKLIENPESKTKIGLHLVLTGNPGTGKTTVARKLGEVLSALDYLDRGHVVEVDKSKLVGQYVGETPIKVQKRCDEAMGGILFIDEAYSLSSGEGSGNSFGQEAVDTLLKRMEDDRDKFVVIAAGYRKEMQRFLNSNTGLKSRFDRFIDIDDYKPKELSDIFKLMTSKNGYNISQEADVQLKGIMEELYNKRDKNFANGRDVRKIFEETLINISKRTSKSGENSLTITANDLPGKEIESKSIDEILSEINNLIGLNNIKVDLQKLSARIQVENERNKSAGKDNVIDYHMVFMGNPGTGKTTIARYLGKIFKAIGLLLKGHLVEADRSDLVGGYVGQTAIKTNELIDSAIGGVLFIDEAYSLVVEDSKNDFGKEAVQILLKRMEDDRGKFITIVAGYPNEMNIFLESNPGLNSRFKKKFIFEDYKPEELLLIFKMMTNEKDLVLTDEAEAKVFNILSDLYVKRDKNFGNGRTVRNLFDSVLENQSFRIVKYLNTPNLNKELLYTIEKEDIEL